MLGNFLFQRNFTKNLKIAKEIRKNYKKFRRKFELKC